MDPVVNYENFLLKEGILNDKEVEEIKAQHANAISQGLEIAFEQPLIQPNTDLELTDLFAPHTQTTVSPSSETKEMRFIDAIQDGLKEGMTRYPDSVIMGQDIAEYGGVFKVTEGFVEAFGKERVRNTPICESAIVGAGLGLSIAGMKAIVEMQFADFVSCGFNQIVNNLAKIHYRWGQNADVIVRMPTGAGSAAGPFQSQSNEAWFFHTPGLKVLYPSSPTEAKGMLLAALEDPNPILFFEHKNLYRSIKEEVPSGYYTTPIGEAVCKSEGSEMTIITYGMGVHWAQEAMAEFEHNSIELIDLRTLLPLDTEAIYNSVRKTGKALVLHEDCLTGGIGGEISALINEHCFEVIDAPVKRLASMDTPVPFAADLEHNFLPKLKLKQAIQDLLDY